MKIFELNDFLDLKKQLDCDKGNKLVMTNGCFDIIHVGHIKLFEESKKLGTHLVVALNSDKSVKRIKGPSRPINNENDRIKVLSAIEFIDFIILFNEETPQKIIQNITPDILAKGSDYSIENIVGANHVISNGGKVVTIDFLEGYSSTKYIDAL
tara:strand:+ start:2408 stop:2869 length:462 start_codon:yes stop_codon:yes gene_type:complete